MSSAWQGAARIFTVGCSFAAVGAVQAGSMQHAAYEDYHTRILPDARRVYDSVGQFTSYVADENGLLNPHSMASGVAIGRYWVLTAAHVVDHSDALTFQVGNQFVSGTRWYVPDRWVSNALDIEGNYSPLLGLNNDIALVRVNQPLDATPKARMATRGGTSAGRTVVSVGYGLGGTGATGEIHSPLSPFPNVLRAGRNVHDVEDHLGFTIDQNGNIITANSREILYDFDAAPTHPDWLPSLAWEADDYTAIGVRDWEREDLPIGQEYTITHGDSGGGLFANHTLVGIHSWGAGWQAADDEQLTLGRFGGLGASTDVGYWNNWLTHVMRMGNRGRLAHGWTMGSILDSIFEFETDDDDTTGARARSMLLQDWLDQGYEVDISTAQYLLGNTTVPEPTTVTLLALAGSAVMMRRRARG